MGDRANVKLVENGEAPIYLYTHWSGEELPELLRQALSVAQPRWGDEPYCNRIIIREIFKDLDGLTGGGVSTYVTDGENRVIVVSHTGSSGYVGTEETINLYTFDEYVNLPSVSWSDLGKENNL